MCSMNLKYVDIWKYTSHRNISSFMVQTCKLEKWGSINITEATRGSLGEALRFRESS